MRTEMLWVDVRIECTVDAAIHPYGSSVSNFALKDSDLNIDVEVSEPAKFLTELLGVLQHDKSGVNL